VITDAGEAYLHHENISSLLVTVTKIFGGIISGEIFESTHKHNNARIDFEVSITLSSYSIPAGN